MKYWIFLNHKLEGPFDKQTLLQIPEFTMESEVCLEGNDIWQAAKQFPDLTRETPAPTIVLSGDYPPDNPYVGKIVTDWREAIIPTDVKEQPTRYTPPVLMSRAAAQVQAPKQSSSSAKRAGQSTWVMAGLWTVFFSLYLQNTDQLNRLEDGLIENAYSTTAPFRTLGHPREKNSRLSKGTHSRRGLDPQRLTKSTTKANPSQKVVEEDVTDLGQGVQMKTVVTYDEKDGKKWETRRYLRYHPGDRFEPM